MNIWRLVHVLAVVIWVGGMFFAHQVLRPEAGTLEPPQRLALWHRVLKRFFRWVTLAIVLILGSGFAMIPLLGGMHAAGGGVHAMLGLGLLMMGIFAHINFAPLRRLGRQVEAEQWSEAASSLATIRLLVGLNLILGALTIALGVVGRGLS